MENEIFARFYDAQLPNADAESHTGSSDTPRDHFSTLPVELRTKIARLVLVYPTKLRITATTSAREDQTKDGRSQGGGFFNSMELSTYKFSSCVKVPKFMVPSNAAAVKEPQYYWNMEPPAIMLALLAVNKDMHEISKPIFYGRNYFEVKDGDASPHRFVVGEIQNGTRLAHRFLELMSWSKARDGTPRYGSRPLVLMRKINIDMEQCLSIQGPVAKQLPWHFKRIINTIITVPRLEKLVVNVRMSHMPIVISWKGKIFHPFSHPELWPGWHKLPWAAPAIVSGRVKDGKSAARLRLFIPENRRVEKRLQHLIDMPDNTPAKFGSLRSEDWSTVECSSALIAQGLQKAEQRWIDACKGAEVMKEQDKKAEDEDNATKDFNFIGVRGS